MKKKKQTQLIEKILNNRNVRKEIATKSLEWFFSLYFNSYIKYKTANFQKEIISIAEDQNTKLAVIVAFRGSGKSTLITTASVLWSILGTPQKKFIIILSQTEQKARQHLQNIKRELEGNDLLRRDLGPFDEEGNQWGATALIIKKFNAKIMIGSVEQSIRGLRFGENRPDFMILDDVEDPNSVRTQESRDKTFEWFTGEVIPAGDRKTRILVVGNLLHEDSLLKRLEKKIKSGEMDGVYREYPIIDENGKPLWPGKYPTEDDIEVERRKTGNNISWAREYLLKIIASDEQLIRPEWIQYYDTLPPEESSYCATGIDPAISKKDGADYTAMVSARVYGHGKNLKIYILSNIVNERLSSKQTSDRAELISDSLGRGKLFVEDVGYQASLIEQLKYDGYPVKGVKVHGQDKYARLNAVSYLVESGKVFFAKDTEVLINQLLGFGIEKHDDLADAFSMLLLKITEDAYKSRAMAMSFHGKYDGEFDHLPKDERENMLQVRQNLRNMFLL